MGILNFCHIAQLPAKVKFRKINDGLIICQVNKVNLWGV